MDLNWFNTAMAKPPSQGALEWRLFLEFIEAYFKNRGIKNPIVVEIGTRRNRQKVFYEELLGAVHIGIDISRKHSMPDILGDSRDKETLETLKTMLNGMPVNLLFIDGDHDYEGVKKDYEIYAPLVENIVALHDISSLKHGVWKFWKELNCIKKTVRIGWATGLVILDGERGIYEKHDHKGKYF